MSEIRSGQGRGRSRRVIKEGREEEEKRDGGHRATETFLLRIFSLVYTFLSIKKFIIREHVFLSESFVSYFGVCYLRKVHLTIFIWMIIIN